MQQLGTLRSSSCMPCDGRNWSLCLVWTWHEVMAEHVLSLVSWPRKVYKLHAPRPLWLLHRLSTPFSPKSAMDTLMTFSPVPKKHRGLVDVPSLKGYYSIVMSHCLLESKSLHHSFMVGCSKSLTMSTCCENRLKHWIYFLGMYPNNAHGFRGWKKWR